MDIESALKFQSLTLRLEKDLRREFVKELSSEGMSTRAIAPIVGVNRKTVERDVRGGTNVPPEQASIAPIVGVNQATAVRDLQGDAFASPEPESSDSSVASPGFEGATEMSR